MSDTKISKTQQRVVKLLNISCADTYESARAALESRRLRGDAIPEGRTWRDAAKMSDADLLAALNAQLRPSVQEIADSIIDRY